MTRVLTQSVSTKGFPPTDCAKFALKILEKDPTRQNKLNKPDIPNILKCCIKAVNKTQDQGRSKNPF